MSQNSNLREQDLAKKALLETLEKIETSKDNPFVDNVENDTLTKKEVDPKKAKNMFNLELLKARLGDNKTKMDAFSVKTRDNSYTMKLEDTIINDFGSQMTIPQLNSLTGDILSEQARKNLFLKLDDKYDTVSSDETATITAAFNKCKILEKNYLIKHIELHILSDSSRDIYKYLNQYKDYYHKLRKLKVDCVIETVKIPYLADISGLIQDQQGKLNFTKNFDNIGDDPLSMQAKAQQEGGLNIKTGGAGRSVVYNQKFEDVFEQFDDFMQMKKRDHKIGNKIQKSTIISLNSGWQYNNDLWAEVNNNYIENVSEGLYNEGADSELVKLLQGLIKDEDDRYDDINDELDKKINLTKTTSSNAGAEDFEIAESYFLKCKLYEYLYLKKHNEFMAFFNLFITLIINLCISYIIIILYLKTLTFETCSKIELPNNLIKEMSLFLKGQNTLFGRIQDVYNSIRGSLANQTGGTSKLQQKTSNALDILELIENVVMTAVNVKKYDTQTNKMTREVNKSEVEVKKLLSSIDTLNESGYVANPEIDIDIESEIKNLEQQLDDPTLTQAKRDKIQDSIELFNTLNSTKSFKFGGGLADDIKGYASGIIDQYNDILYTDKRTELLNNIKFTKQQAFINNVRKLLLGTK